MKYRAHMDATHFARDAQECWFNKPSEVRLSRRAVYTLMRGGWSGLIFPCGRRRACVNPDHVRLEPPKDLRGEKHPRSRLSDAQVQALRLEYAVGDVSVRVLAEREGVPQPALYAALTGYTYAHLPGAVPRRKNKRTCTTEPDNSVM